MDKVLEVLERAEAGSGEVGRLRKEGWLPGILNGSKGKSLKVKMRRHELELILAHHTSENLILDVSVGGKKASKVLLSEIQRDTVSDELLHADLVEISMTKKMRFHVTLELIGEPIGVTQDGGVLEHLLREVEVECLPMDLPEMIEVDVAGLHLGKTLFVRDIASNPKIAVLTQGNIAIASVLMPKVEEEKPAEEAVEGAEPEVIGEKKEEGEEGSDAGGEEKGKAEKGKSEQAEKGKAEKGKKEDK